jgi:NTP pyrophosphatase (non-canonical NTP hydrolase)
MDISKIIALSNINKVHPLVRHAKLVEESGEFAEALLHKLGHLPHKTMKEPIEGEVADIIICALDTLRSVYMDLTPEDFVKMLQKQLDTKAEKWENILIPIWSQGE